MVRYSCLRLIQEHLVLYHLYLRYVTSEWYHLLLRLLLLRLLARRAQFLHLQRRIFLTTVLRKQHSHSICSQRLTLFLDLRCVQLVRYLVCQAHTARHSTRLRRLFSLSFHYQEQFLSLLIRRIRMRLLKLLSPSRQMASRFLLQRVHTRQSLQQVYLLLWLRSFRRDVLTSTT